MSTFDAIIGQPQIVSTLKEAVAAAKNSEDISQEMTHAWLFTGPPGSGRSNAAIAFAAAFPSVKWLHATTKTVQSSGFITSAWASKTTKFPFCGAVPSVLTNK